MQSNDCLPGKCFLFKRRASPPFEVLFPALTHISAVGKKYFRRNWQRAGLSVFFRLSNLLGSDLIWALFKEIQAEQKQKIVHETLDERTPPARSRGNPDSFVPATTF
jgi:hypothetical protein